MILVLASEITVSSRSAAHGGWWMIEIVFIIYNTTWNEFFSSGNHRGHKVRTVLSVTRQIIQWLSSIPRDTPRDTPSDLSWVISHCHKEGKSDNYLGQMDKVQTHTVITHKLNFHVKHHWFTFALYSMLNTVSSWQKTQLQLVIPFFFFIVSDIFV